MIRQDKLGRHRATKETFRANLAVWQRRLGTYVPPGYFSMSDVWGLIDPREKLVTVQVRPPNPETHD